MPGIFTDFFNHGFYQKRDCAHPHQIHHEMRGFNMFNGPCFISFAYIEKIVCGAILMENTISLRMPKNVGEPSENSRITKRGKSGFDAKVVIYAETMAWISARKLPWVCPISSVCTLRQSSSTTRLRVISKSISLDRK